jgi:hypothetical protein
MKKFMGAEVINKVTGQQSAKIAGEWVGNCPAVNNDNDIDCLYADAEVFYVHVWGKDWEKTNGSLYGHKPGL